MDICISLQTIEDPKPFILQTVAHENATSYEQLKNKGNSDPVKQPSVQEPPHVLRRSSRLEKLKASRAVTQTDVVLKTPETILPKPLSYEDQIDSIFATESSRYARKLCLSHQMCCKSNQELGAGGWQRQGQLTPKEKNLFILLFLIMEFLISAPLHSKFLYPSHSCREPASFPYKANREDSNMPAWGVKDRNLRVLTGLSPAHLGPIPCLSCLSVENNLVTIFGFSLFCQNFM